MSDMPLHLFVHLPKTAGQAVRTHMRQHIPDRRAFAALNAQDEDRRDEILSELKARGPRLKLLMGHRVDRAVALEFAHRPIRLGIVLRDPSSYVVSRFNWNVQGRNLEPNAVETVQIFHRWLRSKGNPQARWLLTAYGGQDRDAVAALDEAALLQQASEILDAFWCVGCTSDIAETMAPFFSSLGISAPFDTRKNVAGRDYPRSVDATEPRIVEPVERNTRVDAALYTRYAGARSG